MDRSPLVFYQDFLKEKGTDPAVRYETARVNLRVAGIYRAPLLGQVGDAEPPLRQAIAHLESLVAEFPDEALYRRDLADAQSLLALTFLWAHRYDEAIGVRQRELELREQLVRDFPAVEEHRRGLARAHTDIGNVLMDAQQFGEAEAHDRIAVAIWNEFRRGVPASEPRDLDDEAHVHHWLGRVLMATRGKEAAQEIQHALALREKLVALRPLHSDSLAQLAHLQVDAARLMQFEGEFARAVPFLQRAIDLHRRLIDDFPSVGEHRRRLGVAYGYLGEVFRELGRDREAEDAYRRCLAIRAELVAERPREFALRANLAGSHFELAFFLHDAGRTREAAESFGLARKECEAMVALFPHDGRGYEWLVRLLAICPDPNIRDPARAVRLARKAVDRQPQRGVLWSALGMACCRAGDCDAAIGALEKAAVMLPSPQIEDWLYLAMAHWKRGEPDRARAWLAKANRWIEESRCKDRDVLRLDAEAAALIGMGAQPAPTVKKEDDPARPPKP